MTYYVFVSVRQTKYLARSRVRYRRTEKREFMFLIFCSFILETFVGFNLQFGVVPVDRSFNSDN